MRRRKTRIPGVLDGCVAVPAVNSQLGRVMLMAERNRLRKWTLDVCEICRLVYLPADVANQTNEDDDAINACLGNGVYTAMKDLRHFESLTCIPAEHYSAVIEAVRFLRIVLKLLELGLPVPLEALTLQPTVQ